MATGLLHLHNLLRWIILVLLLVSIVKAYTGWQSKKEFDAADKKTCLFTMIAGMIAAIVFLTLAHGVAKKNLDSTTKYKKAFYFFVVALVLILAGVPWPFRGIEIARPLFPGM
ncbi:MAG: hypothetical protein NTW77_04730 [Bacteroidetes bacterium]|nr:hypothetical protein [Bacteroidota bacterium]